jgi:NAD(P)-dependent dehydrogenase (short-subunit alcohol dehydrogenase family)
MSKKETFHQEEARMSILDRFKLDGKSAFVTGGAQGIGKSIATAIAQAGADVAIADINGELAKAAAAEIAEATGRKAIALRTDVTDPGQVGAMMEAILAAFGKLDVAFCNAGIATHTPAEEMGYEEWRKVVAVNLDAVFLTCVAAGRQMLKQGGGSIIATASMSGHVVNVPQPQCSYNASKAGVVMLAKSLAVEWAKRNVRVNSISPGYIATDLTVSDPQLAPLIEEWNALTPVGRLGKMEELQAIAVYLASDASPFTTGSDFVIDGAYSCV